MYPTTWFSKTVGDTIDVEVSARYWTSMMSQLSQEQIDFAFDNLKSGKTRHNSFPPTAQELVILAKSMPDPSRFDVYKGRSISLIAKDKPSGWIKQQLYRCDLVSKQIDRNLDWKDFKRELEKRFRT